MRLGINDKSAQAITGGDIAGLWKAQFRLFVICQFPPIPDYDHKACAPLHWVFSSNLSHLSNRRSITCRCIKDKAVYFQGQ